MPSILPFQPAQFAYNRIHVFICPRPGSLLASLLIYPDFAQGAIGLHRPAEQSIYSNKPAGNSLLLLSTCLP